MSPYRAKALGHSCPSGHNSFHLGHHNLESSTKKIGEDWSVMLIDEEIIAVYHHCKGTKGLVTRSIMLKYGVRSIVYRQCDLCSINVPEDIQMIVKIYNMKI